MRTALLLAITLWTITAQGMIALPEDKTPWYRFFTTSKKLIHHENKTWQRIQILDQADASKQVTLTFLSPTHQETIVINGLVYDPPALQISRTQQLIALNPVPKEYSRLKQLVMVTTVVAGGAIIYYYLAKEATEP